MKKSMYAMPIITALLALSSCSFDITIGGSSSKDASSTASSSSNGENFSSVPVSSGSKIEGSGDLKATVSSSKYNYEELALSQEDPVFPSTGEQHILVVPITIKGYEKNATAATKANIQKTLFGEADETGWQSLTSYYHDSSYGLLNIKGTVADWYACGLTAAEVVAANDGYESKVSAIINAAVESYRSKSGISTDDYDANADGYLDAVMAIYSCPNASSSVWNDTSVSYYNDDNSTFWAFTYNIFDKNGNSPVASTSAPTANKYFWASYDFMYEGYGSAVDAHTFIHETGHLMGLDDYYDYGDNSGKSASPMGAIDMMDNNIIDHNAFSKFSLGWNSAYVVSGTSGSVSLDLAPSATNGGANCVILPTSDGWNGSAFDEYMMLEFYTPTGLNEKDSESAYSNGLQGFTENGIRIYHVDARMATEVYSTASKQWTVGGVTDEIVSNESTVTVQGCSNTLSYNLLGSTNRLITAIDAGGRQFNKIYSNSSSQPVADNTTLFQKGDSFSFASYSKQFPLSTMDDGNEMPYTVSVTACSSKGATITVSVA